MSKSTLRQQISTFFSGDSFAVVGASNDRAKFGNTVLRAYVDAGHEVFPVNPREARVEGLQAYASLASLPKPVHGISIVTPPAVTEQVVREAIALGIQHIWMQPGAESELAVRLAVESGASVIAGDACVLVEMR